MNRELPVLFHQKEECCGCSACKEVCPVGAICMVSDEEGFWYPKVNKNKCIRCYRCLKVCPFKVCIDK